MSLDTNEVVNWMVGDARPVRRVSKPWLRVTIWLSIAAPYLLMVILLMSPRPDLGGKLMETRFQIEQIAALVAAVAAAYAAFAAVVPGWSRWPQLLISLAIVIWLATLGAGCVSDWQRLGRDGLALMPDWICFPAIAIAGAVPAVTIVAMLRKGAPLNPVMTVALAGLAAAALGNFGLRFFHPQDAGLMVLVWQFGSVVLLTLIAGAFGKQLMSWRRLLAGA